MHLPPSSASRVPQSIVKGSVAPEIRVQPPTVKGTVQPSSKPQPSHAVKSRVPQSTVSGSIHPSQSKRPDASSQTIVRDFASQKPRDSSRTAIRDVSTKPESTSKGTQLLRDGAPIAKGTQLLRDASLKPGTQLLRDGAPTAEGTQLFRDASLKPGTQLLRDDATTTQGTQLLRDASSKPGTRLFRDSPPAGSKLPGELAGASKYVASRAVGGTVPKPASSLPKSLRPGDKDKVWASRQSVYKSLKPNEKKEQDAWANRIIEGYGRCPEEFGWKRREGPGGYQCNGGGHIVTDELLQDMVDKDKLGIYASENRAWDESTWDGPYYETFRGSGIWNKE
jgi:hypothetical protein